ncbi:type II toxin-antitoxin system Phd/YefM family antitoxin [Nocardia sp. NPDC057227]|uniref:type II toxin-antitoxin system Phd/YefM family antitoxin n=1 Tax=Nocardia sp. NPDC057227 TaxID=3346056 RepID=UPI00363EEFC8
MASPIKRHEVTSGSLRSRLADVLNRIAYAGDRVVVTRHGKAIAAVISANDLRLLEELEDARDAALLRRAVAEDNGSGIPVDDLRRDLLG